jgi:hypothetical protein
VSVFLSPVSWLCCLSPSSLLHFSFWVISFLWVDAIRGFFCYQEWWFIEGSQNNFSTGEHKAASKGFKKDNFFFLSKKHPSLESLLLKGSTIPWKVSTTSLHCQTFFRHFEKLFNHRKNGPFIDRS